MIPNLVRAIFLQPEEVQECFDDKEYCIRSEANPDGIPIWKIFALHWGSDLKHPLGLLWQLQPEDYSMAYLQKGSYIGYSVEEICRSRRFIPAAEREKQAFVMAKWLGHLKPGPDTAWPADYYEAASRELGIKFAAGADHREGDPAVQLPAVITNIGQLPQIDVRLSVFAKYLLQTQLLISSFSFNITWPSPKFSLVPVGHHCGFFSCVGSLDAY